MPVPYFPFGSDTPWDFQNHINTIVDAVNNPAQMGTGGTGEDVDLVEVADADTGRVTVNDTLTRYLYRYIHVALASDAVGTPITDLGTYAGTTIFIGVLNSDSETLPASPTYRYQEFAWAMGHSVVYQTAGEGRIFFATSATGPDSEQAEITTITAVIDTAVPTVTAELPDVLESDNFVSGTSGFTQSLRTGVAEFDQVTIQGDSFVNSQTINGTSFVRVLETERTRIVGSVDDYTGNFIQVELLQSGEISFNELIGIEFAADDSTLPDFTTNTGITTNVEIAFTLTDHDGVTIRTTGVVGQIDASGANLDLVTGPGTVESLEIGGVPRGFRWNGWADQLDLMSGSVGDFIQVSLQITTTNTDSNFSGWELITDSTTTGRQYRNQIGVLIRSDALASSRITSGDPDQFALDVSGGEGLRVGPDVLFRGNWQPVGSPDTIITGQDVFDGDLFVQTDAASVTGLGAVFYEANQITIGAHGFNTTTQFVRALFTSALDPNAFPTTIVSPINAEVRIVNAITGDDAFSYRFTAGVSTLAVDTSGIGTITGVELIGTIPTGLGQTRFASADLRPTTSVGLTLDGDLISVHTRFRGTQGDRTRYLGRTDANNYLVVDTGIENDPGDISFRAVTTSTTPSETQVNYGGVTNINDISTVRLGFPNATDAQDFLDAVIGFYGFSGGRFRIGQRRFGEAYYGITRITRTNSVITIGTRFEAYRSASGDVFTSGDLPITANLSNSYAFFAGAHQQTITAVVPRFPTGAVGTSPVSPVGPTGQDPGGTLDDVADRTGQVINVELGAIRNDFGAVIGSLVYQIRYVSNTVRVPTLQILEPTDGVGITQVTRHATLM